MLSQPPRRTSMQTIDFDEILDRIVEKDSRYDREAYMFLREALDFTQKAIGKKNKGEIGHITGEQLLHGIREYALANFGPMTIEVFKEWGIRSCEDFGHMVFAMVEHNLLRKRQEDTIEEFKAGYSFEEAFRKPFLPSRKARILAPEPGERKEVEAN